MVPGKLQRTELEMTSLAQALINSISVELACAHLYNTSVDDDLRDKLSSWEG